MSEKTMISSHDIDGKQKPTRHAIKDVTNSAISTRNADKNGKVDLVKLGLKRAPKKEK